MSYSTQNQLLLNKLMEFYSKDNNIDKILPIINGEHKVSLRLIDWFVTNYSKKYYTTFNITSKSGNARRFKVYVCLFAAFDGFLQMGGMLHRATRHERTEQQRPRRLFLLFQGFGQMNQTSF